MGKGQDFERDFCKQLSLWWTNKENDSVFWRTPNSGGRATVRSKKGEQTKNQYGDVLATDPIGQVLIDNVLFELKRGYKCHWADLLEKPLQKEGFNGWIKKVCQSKLDARIPYFFFVAKRDRYEAMVVTNLPLPNKIGFWKAAIHCSSGDLHVCSLKDFFLMVGPEAVRSLVKNGKKKSGR